MLKKIIIYFYAKLDNLINVSSLFVINIRTFLMLENKPKNRMKFGILTVKNTNYVNMAIKNINSMHLRNNSHHFEIYTDTNNLNLLKNNLIWINHAENVNIILATKNHDNWMAYKIDYLISCINNDRILVDSDTIWFSDLTPHINSNYIYLSHLAYHFSDNDDEAKHLVWLFGEAILDYKHYVSCLVYVPRKHWNNEYSTRLTNNFKVLYDYFSKNNLTHLQRLSEELAINITLQQIFPADLLRVVKNTGSDFSRHIYQPIYYGAKNKVL